MPILQSIDGKYYDVPDDKAPSFEVPREKVKELLSKTAPPPSAQAGPGPGPGGGRRPSGPMGGPGGSPVIIQVLPNGVHGPAAHAAPPPSGGRGPDGQDGDVDPYWWWTNFHYGPYWRNTWGNY